LSWERNIQTTGRSVHTRVAPLGIPSVFYAFTFCMPHFPLGTIYKFVLKFIWVLISSVSQAQLYLLEQVA